jgi:hypothetical protein
MGLGYWASLAIAIKFAPRPSDENGDRLANRLPQHPCRCPKAGIEFDRRSPISSFNAQAEGTGMNVSSPQKRRFGWGIRDCAIIAH